MIIKKVLLDRKRYSLVEDDYCHNSNIFTIIVGSNGKGKSRLLKRIVNNIKNAEFEGEKVPNNYSRQVDVDFLGRYLSLYSSPSESKSFFSINKPNIEFINEQLNVISVTTTPFDKFPVEYRGNYLYRYHDDHRYTYIGLKVSKNSLNQSNFLNLLARSLLKSERIFNNGKLFSLLKLSVYAGIIFKSRFAKSFGELAIYKLNKLNSASYENDDEILKQYFIEKIKVAHNTIYLKLFRAEELDFAYEAYMRCVGYLDGVIEPRNPEIPKEEIIYLLDIGLINVSDVVFHDLVEDEYMLTSDLSSGQKCMILTLLNIAGSITDNSVICIDEPELSLHPKWQKEYMKVLIEFFSDYKNCHFIIATHSPLIISELSNENCHILNMDLGYATKADKYRSMSSDYQLAEVFGIAGNNNEYLNRIVVSLLSKLSVERSLNNEDVKKIKEMLKLSQQMDDGDSVKELIEILDLAWKKVSKNVN